MFRVYIKSSPIIFEGLLYNVCMYLYINIYAHIFIFNLPQRFTSSKQKAETQTQIFLFQ